MPQTFYRVEFNEIVIAVTDSQVVSDMWAFPDPVALGDIRLLEIRRARHKVSTLAMPALALFLSGFFGYALLRGAATSGFTRVAGPALALLFLGSGIAGVARFLRNHSNDLWLTTRDGREGVLYRSNDDATFREFASALLAALRSRGGAMPEVLGFEPLASRELVSGGSAP